LAKRLAESWSEKFTKEHRTNPRGKKLERGRRKQTGKRKSESRYGSKISNKRVTLKEKKEDTSPKISRGKRARKRGKPKT